jgi:hypothetical protein
MAIELELDAGQRGGTTHEGFKVEVRVRNNGPAPVEAPNLYDTSAALTFEIYSSAAHRLRQMNGVTQQIMLAGVRPDSAPTLEDLGPGETWNRTIDLAPYHYLLPAGDLRLRARYEYEPSQIRAFSPLIRVVVTDPPLTNIAFRRETGMLDSLVVILRAQPSEQSAWFLRQYSFGSPLAAWYSEPILAGEAAQTVVCSTATFAHAETYDPVFERWVVWTNEGIVKCQFHRSGQAAGEPRQAEVPAGWRLLPWCNHDRNGGPFLFFEAAPGRLECRRFEADGLRPVFGYDFSGKIAAVRADSESVHLLLERGGLIHERLNATGEIMESRKLFHSRLPLCACEIEPFTGSVKALFREGPRGGSLEMFGASLRTGESNRAYVDRFPLRQSVTELSFDVDLKGRFHLLAATSDGSLYYLGPKLGPLLVARGDPPFFPQIIAQSGVYLGYRGAGVGYRFSQFLPRRWGSKIVLFEESL